MSGAAQFLEVEWQFVADDLAAVRAWLDERTPAPFHAQARPERLQEDAYWDTEGWLIWRAGFACRVRRCGETAELTIKGLSGGEANLRRRFELNEPLDDPGDLAGTVAAPAGPASALLSALAGPHPLRPVAALATRRTPLTLTAEGAILGEIALDRTTVGEGWRAHDLLRVEVDIDPDALDRAEPFVRALREGARLRPARSGKLAAALAAAGASPGWEPRPLGPLAIDRGSALGEVAYATLRRDFLRLVEHEPVARLGEDREGVHQIRVSARRLRAALDVFREALPPELVGRRRDLRWIGRSLGEARDLDVQRERFTRAAPLIGRKAAAAITAIFAERHARAREGVLATLNDERYVAFLDAMAAALRDGPAPERGAEAATDAAPARIAELRRVVRQAGDAIDGASPDAAYHALRLKVKQLRYAVEFFAPLYGEPAEAWQRQLVRLQTLLGDHQDAVVAEAFYRALAKREGEALGHGGVRAARELAANAAAEAESFRWKFPKRYARLRGAQWRAFKAAMGQS